MGNKIKKQNKGTFEKKKHLKGLLGVLVLSVGLLAISSAYFINSTNTDVQASGCIQTGFFRDGINMTAAVVNPTKPVKGYVDATGCNVGVYYDKGVGKVDNANIFGANYFGVLVNGDVNEVSVDIIDSSIHNIGETPFNGSQHGVGVYYRSFGGGSINGKIWNNDVYKYQKGGIVVNGAGTKADIKGNNVMGEGPITYIAQNGIQVGYGAHAQVKKNDVMGHSYSGNNQAADGGVLVVGGPCYGGDYTLNTDVVNNNLDGNDVGVFISNVAEDCVSAPTSGTNIKVVNNVISKSDLTNKYNDGAGHVGYQAGISDQGNNDKLISNTISGDGYSETANPGAYTVPVDADSSFTNKAKIHANVIN